MHLTDLVELISPKLGYSVLTVSCVDDFFRELNRLNVKEVRVNKGQMGIIVHFYLASVGNDKNGNQGEIMRTGKLDKFMNVDLILE